MSRNKKNKAEIVQLEDQEKGMRTKRGNIIIPGTRFVRLIKKY